jgi:hypothetical protein
VSYRPGYSPTFLTPRLPDLERRGYDKDDMAFRKDSVEPDRYLREYLKTIYFDRALLTISDIYHRGVALILLKQAGGNRNDE